MIEHRDLETWMPRINRGMTTLSPEPVDYQDSL